MSSKTTLTRGDHSARISAPSSMRDLSEDTLDPFLQQRKISSALYKRLAYWFARPALYRYARKLLSEDFLLVAPKKTRVLPERGFPMEARRAWLNRHVPLRGARLVVQGTGSGWDTLDWVRYRPGSIIAMDVYSYGMSWRKIRQRTKDDGLVSPDFLLSTLEQIPLKSESADVVVSDAVYEHCVDLESVMRETYRILKPGGYVYCTYGPLWFCFGGDHFSGRGGLQYGYAHIGEPEQYRQYFRKHRSEDADAQSGGRYVELDLFSKLATRDYFAIYAKVGFRIVDLIIEVSNSALQFRRRWPQRIKDMLAKYPTLSRDDLLVKGHFAILQKQMIAHGAA